MIATFNGFTPELPKALDTWYRIKVIANGPHIQVYLNDVLAIDAYDSTYASGYFGLFAFQGTAEYDNLVAEDLDVTPPAWPNGALTASGVTENSLALQWTAAYDYYGVAKYRVYQDGQLIGEVDGDVLGYGVSGLTAETTYTFKVEAGDASGNWSADGPSLSVTTASPPTTTPPDDNPGNPQTPPQQPPSTQPTPSAEPTPPAEPAPTLPANAQIIPADALRPGNDGIARVSLAPGKNEAVLPAGAASLLGDGKLEIASEHGSVTVSAETLRAAAARQANASHVVIGVETLPEAQVQPWIRSGSASGVKLQPVGQVRSVTVAAMTADGEELPLPAGSIPAQLVFEYDEGAVNELLLGAYRYDEQTGTWQFIPGAVDRKQNRVVVSGTDLRNIAILAYDKTFDDVAANHWVHDTLKVLTAQHLVNGMTETTFAPGRPTTRAEFTALLVRALRLQATQPATFTDVKGHEWYAESVAAAQAGLIRGRADGSFDPNGAISREEMAVLMVRALRFLNGGADAVGAERPLTFKDGDCISAWALDDVRKAVEAGLMQGVGGDRFAPRSAVTRAEAAQALFNLLFR